MGLKRFFAIRRFCFVLITGLLYVTTVEATPHSLTIYNIPFVGWILAIGEYRNANVGYWEAIDEGVLPWQEYYLTQTAYDHTHTPALSTLAFLALLLILVNGDWRRNVN